MSAAVWIAVRELRDKSRLFVIASVLAVVPFVAILTLRQNRQLGIVTVAMILAGVYGIALALALGTSAVARDLAERRMGFFFSKPVSATAIWIGKAIGSLATLYGAAAIIALPSIVLAPRGWDEFRAGFGTEITLQVLAGCLIVFFVGHALSIIVRSRSARVGLDFLFIVAAVATVLLLLRPIYLGGGDDLSKEILQIFALVFVSILIIAPLWQLSRGRADLRRNHAALSAAVWSGLLVTVLGIGGYVWWVIRTPPSRIVAVSHIMQDRSGRWAYVTGLAGHGEYMPAYLIDTKTGERERMPADYTLRFAGDGKSFVWFERTELWPRLWLSRLYVRRLEPGARTVATPLLVEYPGYMALSDDGSRVALVNDRQISVHEVETGRLLASAVMRPKTYVRAMTFLGRDRVRLIESEQQKLRATIHVFDLDVANRKLLPRASFQLDDDRGFTMTADGSRIYLRSTSEIVDVRTGAVMTTLQIRPLHPYQGLMLADGTAVVTRDFKLYRMDRDGSVTAEIPLPIEYGMVVGRVGKSKIAIGAGAVTGRPKMVLVDLESKTVQLREGLRGPIFPETVVAEYPDDATFMAIDATQRPVLWNARTLAVRRLPS